MCSLGEEVQKTLGTVMDTKDLDIEPLVSFIFRYRPLGRRHVHSFASHFLIIATQNF